MTDTLSMKKHSDFCLVSFGQPASSQSSGAVKRIADPDISAQRAAAPKAIAVS
jgi:hypothetical protein